MGMAKMRIGHIEVTQPGSVPGLRSPGVGFEQPVEMLDTNPSATLFLSADFLRIRIWPLLSNDDLLTRIAQRFPPLQD